MAAKKNIIEVQNARIDFPVLVKKKTSLNLFSTLNIQSLEKVNALNDISFSVSAGNRIGLMGRNGAGKSTLLKALAGAIPLSSGKIVTQGRITNLLNVGLGMHPEASGFENILLRGLYMGISMREMKMRVPGIVEFSELENAIYNPIYTYSAGMLARLQLSIALSNDPEILLMDEWLGRGDPQFQDKAAKKLTEYVDRAGILVIASHSEKLLYRLCNRIIHLDEGEVISDVEVGSEEKRRVAATPKEKAIAKKIEMKRLARQKEKQRIRIKERRKKEIQREKRAQRKLEIQKEKRAQRKLEIQKEKRAQREQEIQK